MWLGKGSWSTSWEKKELKYCLCSNMKQVFPHAQILSCCHFKIWKRTSHVLVILKERSRNISLFLFFPAKIWLDYTHTHKSSLEHVRGISLLSELVKHKTTGNRSGLLLTLMQRTTWLTFTYSHQYFGKIKDFVLYWEFIILILSKIFLIWILAKLLYLNFSGYFSSLKQIWFKKTNMLREALFVWNNTDIQRLTKLNVSLYHTTSIPLQYQD